MRVSELPTVVVKTGWGDIAYVTFSGLLVLVSAFQAWLLFGTLRVTRNSAMFAERAVRNSERADILLDAVSIQPSATGVFDGDARLVLRFKNFGRTRASNVRFDVRMIIPGTPVNSPAPELPVTVMGTAKEQSIAFQTFREFLTQATFEDIVRGRATLKFVGSVVYEDVFGDSYTTRDVGVFDYRVGLFRIEENIAG
jgi:hypothetical protein